MNWTPMIEILYELWLAPQGLLLVGKHVICIIIETATDAVATCRC